MAKKLAKYVAQQKLYQQTERGKQTRKTARERYRNTEKGRQSRKRTVLRYLYKMSAEEYDQMFEKQKGCCAICGKRQSENVRGRALAVDHNHKTKKVRGLLCYMCNRALGQLKVDEVGVAYLRKAIEYMHRAA